MKPSWELQVLSLFAVLNWSYISAQPRYSVLEESEPGSFIGNVVQDLGLNNVGISERGLRLALEKTMEYFALNLESGTLVVKGRIDREKLCGFSTSCMLPVEIIIEKPLELFRLEVEIVDVNDNAPHFHNTERIIRMTELAAVGSRFPLERAQDSDVGTNAVSAYALAENQYFSLAVQNRKDDKPFPVLVLDKALDREEQDGYQLVLTAFDSGNPPKSGTILISVIVLDSNDNPPIFDSALYKITLEENSPFNTLVIQLHADDKDEGPNREISYYYEDQTSGNIENVFSLNQQTGEIRVQGKVDYEDQTSYEISVIARDHGVPEMEGHCIVQVDIEDLNDNAPDIILSSFVSSVPEDTPIGTTVLLFSVKDQDSGKNGEVDVQISPSLPFEIVSVQNHYSLITNQLLDRELDNQYTVQLTARDMGFPQLQTEATIDLKITDVNDNPPTFEQLPAGIYIRENNKPGALLHAVSALDKDEGENAHIEYSIYNRLIDGSPTSTFVYIDKHNGNIYAQQSFDHEEVQHVEFTVTAEDFGSPKRSSNISIHLYILDDNDNSPTILFPEASQHLQAPLPIPKALPVGSLVTKVVAVDADSGYNAWLTYNLTEVSSLNLFKIIPHTGEIKLARNIHYTDLPLQKLFVLVKDHGNPPKSSTATLLISLDDNVHKQSMFSNEIVITDSTKQKHDLTLYLVISLVAVSIVSAITFLILLTKCIRRRSTFGKWECCCLRQSQSTQYLDHTHKTLQLDPNGTLQYFEVSMASAGQQSQSYLLANTPNVDSGTLNIMRSLNFPQLKDLVNTSEDTLPGGYRWKETLQAPPNADWHISQAQRPGPSGAQPAKESGVWPNNQFETERLQAMILASANEAAEGSSALGGGTGTMGLSARYGPQFTLQHLPDYRQNIYIPGTTSTLTNAAGKGKSAAPSGGNKKKSGKKDKK
ncbi:protocadherin gamma-C5 isoform X13 [Xenopus laevis]|uniref:Protocadherin gamma-C5 isoform X13 n=1 Tax=Xenopus laevis TaxID=8355 RepID=A0A8J1MKN2_XENLA|nr:protocadherin gamma-C5 isoform X13 [Xenopus laevis]